MHSSASCEKGPPRDSYTPSEMNRFCSGTSPDLILSIDSMEPTANFEEIDNWKKDERIRNATS